jgi:hypothetical protein
VDTFIFLQKSGSCICGTVVDDDNLEVCKRLNKQRIQRYEQGFGHIKGRHDDGGKGHGGILYERLTGEEVLRKPGRKDGCQKRTGKRGQTAPGRIKETSRTAQNALECKGQRH